MKLQLLSTAIQTKVSKDASSVSDSQVQDYYDAAKSQFSTPETRDVRLVLNKDQAKVEQAKSALEADDSAASWKKVAKQYSTDPSSKDNGGLRQGLTDGLLEEPLNGEVFGADVGQVEGPVKTPLGYYVFEVDKISPGHDPAAFQGRAADPQPAPAAGAAERVLAVRLRLRHQVAVAHLLRLRLRDQPLRQLQGQRAIPKAPAACYEANPKGGLPEACPAPVLALSPALPGTVTLLTPQGTRLPQRPVPAGLQAGALGGRRGRSAGECRARPRPGAAPTSP